MPKVTSPSELNVISEPLMRGDPSRRKVARVLFVPESKRRRTRAAKSGASVSICLQLAKEFLPHSVEHGLEPHPRRGFSTEAVQTAARVNVTCVTPLGEEVASTW